MSANINFDPRFFTKVYRMLRRARGRYVMNYGGSGSGKSHAEAQNEIIRCLELPQKVLTVRRFRSTIKDSCIDLHVSILEEWGLSSLYWMNWSRYDLNFANGSKILFRGMDDPRKLKSIHGIRRVSIEEAEEIEEADFKEVDRRLRGFPDHQIVFNFNPVSEHHWLKQRFFRNRHDPARNTSAIHSTYTDNPYNGKAYHQMMMELRDHDEDEYRVYALGDWGQIKSGFEFYKHFSSKHVKFPKYDPDQPLHVSFDFNVNPYMTCVVFQVDGKHIRQIDELCLGTPKNNTQDTAKEFAEQYRDHERKVFLYGDPAGRAEGTRTKEGRNDFSLIKQELDAYEFDVEDRVLRKAPDVHARGDFANAVLRGWNEFDFEIHEECRRSIEDFQFVKQNADGTKMKKKEKDPESGVMMEMMGHTSDAFDYFVVSAFRGEYRDFHRGGVKNYKPPRISIGEPGDDSYRF
jgi:phage terminase large subunit